VSRTRFGDSVEENSSIFSLTGMCWLPLALTTLLCWCVETERVYECDMVLLAMGFVGPEKSIVDELSLSLDARGNITSTALEYATSVPRVYTAGGTFTLPHTL